MASPKAHYTPEFLEAWEKVKLAEQMVGLESRLANDANGVLVKLMGAREVFRDEMLRIGHDQRILNLYRVKDKRSGKAVFFRPNYGQHRYLQTRTGHDIILKPRQVGYTTLSAVREYDLALWTPNMTVGIMAHKKDRVLRLFNKTIKFIHFWFQRDWDAYYSPTVKADNATTLSFKDDGCADLMKKSEEHPDGEPRILNSSVAVSYDFRGDTLDVFHSSETSRTDPDILSGSMNSCADNAEFILESTPFGRGGEFYRIWKAFEDGGDIEGYQGHFIPWFEHYPEDVNDGKWRVAGEVRYSVRELELIDIIRPHLSVLRERFECDGEMDAKAQATLDEHIFKTLLVWRRWTIKNRCKGDEEMFESEFPSDTKSCFLAGESSVFPYGLLQKQDEFTREPAWQGFVLMQGSVPTFVADKAGCYSIWEKPSPTGEYCMGADSAGGVGKDAAVAYIKNRKTGEFVAKLEGQFEPNDFGLELYKFGTWYNRAWICPEENNHGHTVLQALKNAGYTNIYKRIVYDELTQKKTKKLGFVTTNASKLDITELFKKNCRNGKTILRDAGLIDQMSFFVQIHSKAGTTIKREAVSGEHDDRVIAAALTEEMDRALGEILSSDSMDFDRFDPYAFDASTGLYTG